MKYNYQLKYVQAVLFQNKTFNKGMNRELSRVLLIHSVLSPFELVICNSRHVCSEYGSRQDIVLVVVVCCEWSKMYVGVSFPLDTLACVCVYCAV